MLSATPLQLNNVSPIIVPNIHRQYLGWNVDAAGIFYIRQLPLLSNSNAQCLFQLREVRSSKIIAQEVHSDVVDHSEWGTFEDCKLEEDSYVYHYYYAFFYIYVIPFLPTHGLIPNCT